MQGTIILFIIIIMMGFAGKWYYTTTQDTIIQLEKNNTMLSQTVEEQNITIEKQKQNALENEKASEELTIQLQEAREYEDNLVRKLQKHNLTKLAIAKPGLIETRINNGTEKLREKLELITTE